MTLPTSSAITGHIVPLPQQTKTRSLATKSWEAIGIRPDGYQPPVGSPGPGGVPPPRYQSYASVFPIADLIKAGLKSTAEMAFALHPSIDVSSVPFHLEIQTGGRTLYQSASTSMTPKPGPVQRFALDPAGAKAAQPFFIADNLLVIVIEEHGLALGSTTIEEIALVPQPGKL